MLLVLPPLGAPERPTMQRVAQLSRAKGRQVTVFTEEHLQSIARR